MKVALINAHTSYAQGASGLVDGTTLTEYKLSSKINNALSLQLNQNCCLQMGDSPHYIFEIFLSNHKGQISFLLF